MLFRNCAILILVGMIVGRSLQLYLAGQIEYLKVELHYTFLISGILLFVGALALAYIRMERRDAELAKECEAWEREHDQQKA